MSLLTLSEERQKESLVHPLPTRCGLVLAAGDGKRLQPYIKQLRGDHLPKQYVNFFGSRSMLEQTCRRAEKLIPSERLFTVVGSHHLSHMEVWCQLSGRPEGTVVFQPKNRETGPGLLLPLMHISKRYPESIVSVYPADHYIPDETRFMDYVDLAYRIVEEDPSKLTMLGIKPHRPEPGYGYIMPGRKMRHLTPSGIYEVLHFIEKPDLQAARRLIDHGGLWNTMVMVFKTRTVLELIRSIMPSLYAAFEKIGEAIGTPSEAEEVEALYNDLEPVNFSKHFLERLSCQESSRITVLQVEGVYWNDWGSAERIESDSIRHQEHHLLDHVENKSSEYANK